MENKRKLLALLLAVIMTLSVAMLGGCDSGNQPAQTSTPTEPETGEYLFDFVGSAQYEDGEEYTFRIRAPKEGDGSFLLTIDELHQFELGGTYTYVENKGYKLYFDDIDGQFAYSSYDPETKEFSVKYTLDLGEMLGKRRVTFTAKDEDFAEIYDGEGLGVTPPTFEGGGWGGYKAQFVIEPAKLTCYEDGTAVFTATAVTAVDTKTGTWDYDAETNTYHFWFPPQTFANTSNVEVQEDGTIGYQTVYSEGVWRYDSYSEQTATDFYTTYDEATGTYNLDLQIVWYVYSIINLSYAE